MKAIRYYEYGEPGDVLKLEDIPKPVPLDDEVLIRLTARSVNPSDLYTIRGKYGIKPKLPTSPGNEGAGIAEEIGKNVKNFKTNDRVTILLGGAGNQGTWKEFICVKEESLMKTPDSLSDEESATSWANYLTIWALINDELNVKEGEQLLMTAGSSHLGRAMLQYAKIKGIKVTATVRKENQKQELLDLGAEAVIATDSESITRKTVKITGGKGFPHAIDAVGGKIGSDTFLCVSNQGTLVVYGLMSNEPLQINGSIIFSEAIIKGFWLVRWMTKSPKEHIQKAVDELNGLFKSGKLVSQIDSKVDLTDLKGILDKNDKAGRHGKVVVIGPK